MIVSRKIAKLLKRLGYNELTVDEYWMNYETPQKYIEAELIGIKPEFRLPAPKPYDALTWLAKFHNAKFVIEKNYCQIIGLGKCVEKYGAEPDVAIIMCLEKLVEN